MHAVNAVHNAGLCQECPLTFPVRFAGVDLGKSVYGAPSM